MSDSTKKNILEWIYCIVIAIILALLIKFFIGTPTVVKQHSMYPTYKPNDRLILNRMARAKMPKRGEVVTFEAPSKSVYGPGEYNLNNPVAKYQNQPNSILKKFLYYVLEVGKTSYIKRVIAIEGDKVEIKNGHVYINGELLHEKYLQDGVNTEPTGVFNNFVVPKGCVFLMGDNRSGSMDCRSFGCIPVEKIESKVVFRFWPLNKIGPTQKEN
ncbi:MAG: signal peptidase I [Clostridiales bacterium]|nr:signal peptidase I [Clostridiales bacterium]